MKLSNYFFVLALMGGTSVPAGAAGLLDEARDVWQNGKASHVLDVDNDSLKLNRDDGLYTSGLRYTQRYSVNAQDGLKVFGWRIGQELYTASDINLAPELVGPPDHPYAAWLYAGMFSEEHDRDGRRLRVGIDFGCIGPCAGGEATQDFLHGVLDQPRPKGWDKQIRNEAGLVLYGEFTPKRWPLGKHVDIAPTLHGRFGNIFTDAGASINMRFGKLNMLPNEAAFHGFVRLDGRAVAYNASLQGGYFSNDDPHTVKPKRFVSEAEAGLVWTDATFGILLSVVHRSNEIEGLPDSTGEQNFVRLSISYTP